MSEIDKNDVCEVYCIHDETVARIQKQMLDDTTKQMLAETFKILGDPTRVGIIHALSHTELCVCDVAAVAGITQSAASHQLRILRNLRLVKFRKEGKIVYYSIDDKHIINLFTEGLEHIKHG